MKNIKHYYIITMSKKHYNMVKNKKQKVSINFKKIDDLKIADNFKLMDLYFKQYNIMNSHLHNNFNKLIGEDI